jgi:N-acetyltransferase 10
MNHQLMILCAHYPWAQNVMPDILAVVQVALEGAISRKSAVTGLARGELPQVCGCYSTAQTGID